MKIYTVINNLSEMRENGGLFLYPNDVIASVELAEAMHNAGRRINESSLYRIGEIDDKTHNIINTEKEKLEWDTRRIREVKMEDATKEEIKKDMSNL